jgi:hypothetical protein
MVYRIQEPQEDVKLGPGHSVIARPNDHRLDNPPRMPGFRSLSALGGGAVIGIRDI